MTSIKTILPKQEEVRHSTVHELFVCSVSFEFDALQKHDLTENVDLFYMRLYYNTCILF